ncbi:hypothetical protein CRE_20693 [Caenorhabditis remanei]|uniref:C2H2-type domain-containing protein n=1 Tax=Caenorhabditis remanei TaxID=31234 RepID=E3MFE3_CAERE|nr:hypothetical protein CRE_20693 [Caenorhabditis remanei]
MSYEDLKPVRFDYDDHYQPPPVYYNSYSHEPDPYHPPQPQYIQMMTPSENGHNNHHYQQVNSHHVHQHHQTYQHQIHQHQNIAPTHVPHQNQHLHYTVIDNQDSDSQDSMDSTFQHRPMTQAKLSGRGNGVQKQRFSVEDDSEDLSEEVQNHWMPMTWCERSSDDPQVFNFVCLWGQCVAVSTGKDEFINHLFSHVPGREDSIQQRRYSAEDCITCKVRGCGAQLASIDDLSRHVSMHVFQADCQQKGSEALIEKEEYSGIESCGFEPCTNLSYDGMVLTCLWNDCGMTFNSLTDLFDHVGNHIDDVCDIDRLEQEFQNGVKKTVFPCKWTGCNHLAESKSNLRRHGRHHSGEKMLACPFCARFFSRRDKLYDHCVRRTILMTDPDIEDPYLCKLCQKRFGTERALCMHVTRHLVGHTCPLCALALDSRAAIHRHLMTKHSRRSRDFKCTTCNKMFFTESELNRHAVYHTDVMYSCKTCPEKFKWKKQLLKHMKEHDENYNPSPYTCHLCDRTYTSGFALGRHLTRQHRLQIPYGFSRFTYKKCADGLMRLQTKKLFRNESGENPDQSLSASHVPY